MPASQQRRPWPMKWIIVAILAMIIPYTFVTLRYRKPGKPFQPYEDMKNRANVSRLLAAGYQRIPLLAQRPADSARAMGGADIAVVSGGLPSELRSTLVEVPLLPVEIESVTAAPTASTLLAYVIQLACTLPNDKQQLAGAELFIREGSIVITPTFEPVGGDLQTRSPHAAVLLTVPASALKPGKYSVTVVGERVSRAWSLEVK